MTGVLNTLYAQQLQNHTFSTPGGTFKFSGLDKVRVFLPWPRAYEVRVEFALGVKPAQ